jgi:hypothetical protein
MAERPLYESVLYDLFEEGEEWGGLILTLSERFERREEWGGCSENSKICAYFHRLHDFQPRN